MSRIQGNRILEIVMGFQQMLCPVDFSEHSALGLRYAGKLAKCSGARLMAMHADLFLPPPYFTESSLEELKRQLQDSERQAEAYLREFVRRTLGDAGAEVRIEEGLPADAIRRVVSQAPYDLIVMGTHGRSGMNRLMLGSVTEHVVRETPIPVLAVRGGAEPVEIKRILCPVNDTGVARQALRTATGLARCLGAGVTVLHVREPGATDTIGELCSWIPEEERAACAISEMSAEGDVAREVIARANELGSDLLVLGASHRRFFDTTVIGANTIRILRHAPCPVLAVFAGAGAKAGVQ